jgi:magnesium-transporting ATPase (P-type)
LPTNGGQALLVMGAILLAPMVALFSVRLPLEPIHILWVNLADSVFLTLPLMMEPKETGLLDGPPRDPDEPIANRLFIERVLLVSVLMAATGFATFYWFGEPALLAAHAGEEVDPLQLTQAQTAAFISIQLLHLGFLATARSIHGSAFTFSPFSNRWVLLGMGVTFACILLIVYVPALQVVFRTAPLPLDWWPVILLGLLPGFVGVEIEKALRARRGRAAAHANSG